MLGLLVRGQTNAQIAESLGISLAGAKWHVSEVISKLGVESREDAAEYWRARNGLRLRFTRALRALLPGAGWLKVGGAVAGLAAVSAAVIVVVALVESGGPERTLAESTSAATPTASVPRTPPAVLPRVTGTFSQPQALPIDGTVTIQPPGVHNPFQLWDGTSTVIYDLVSGTQTDLGPGSLGSFSPDGGWVAWVAGTAKLGEDVVGKRSPSTCDPGSVSTLGLGGRRCSPAPRRSSSLSPMRPAVAAIAR